MEKIDNEMQIGLARCLAQCSLHAPREEAKRCLVDRAPDAVESAVKNQYRDAFYLDVETDLDPLRDAPRFRAALQAASP